MKQYQKVNIVICQLEQQDIITESGGINFKDLLTKLTTLGWDPSIGDSWSDEEGWQ